MSCPTPDPEVRINLPGRPAVLAWQCLWSHEGLCLDRADSRSNVTFSVSIDERAPSASLRLRIPIILKGHLNQYTPIFVYFSADAIEGIDEELDIPTRVTNTIKAHPVGLKFRMVSTPVLVVPSSHPQAPLLAKNEMFENAVHLLSSFAQCTVFTIFLSKLGAKDSIDAVRDMAWGKLQWPAMSSTSVLCSMHGGKGGRILPLADILPPKDYSNSLPSYDLLGPPSPPRQRPKKRRRTEAHSVALHDKINRLMESQRNGLQELQELVANQLPKEVAGDGIKDTIDTKLNGLETRLLTIMDQRLDALVESAWSDSRQTPFDVDVSRLDKLVMNTKVELHDYVDRVVKDTADKWKSEINEMA